MGRPNQCNPCCGDAGDPPDPPISQCDDVICIALIDENRTNGRNKMPVLHPLFRAAYPNRLLFVLDVFRSPSVDTMYYSQSFLDDPLAFSLRVEFDDPSGPAGLIRLLARDFGDNTIATANDPWNIILAIKEHYPSAKAIFDAASEISIFIDDSGSMRVSHVEATIARMRADAISSGYTVAASTSNAYEEIICPFAQSQCCSSDAQALMDACGVDVDCGATSLSFIQSPDNGLIREYCDNNSRFPTDGEYFDVCNTCITPAEENEDQTIEYTALAANSQGQNADHVEIRYTLESSDNGTDWTTIENLDNGFSGTQQELNVLIDNWGGSSIDPYDCHQWLSGGGEWGQLGSDIDGEAVGDFSGYSVSLNAAGDRVAIGAPYNDGNGAQSGHTRIFEWNGNNWTQLGGDIDGEAAFDESGYSVSLNAAGDRVATGAPSNDNDDGGPNDQTNSGHTRIFEWSGSSWTQLGSDIDGEAALDVSGYSVSLNAAGDRVATGAPSNDSNGYQSGHTRIFDIDTTNDGTGACFLYQDTTVGSCKTRIWTRQFRIKAETIGYPLSAYSNSFKLYEWRNQEFII